MLPDSSCKMQYRYEILGAIMVREDQRVQSGSKGVRGSSHDLRESDVPVRV